MTGKNPLRFAAEVVVSTAAILCGMIVVPIAIDNLSSSSDPAIHGVPLLLSALLAVSAGLLWLYELLKGEE